MKDIFLFVVENWVEIFAVITAIVSFVEAWKHKGWKDAAKEREALLETVITSIGFEKTANAELKKEIEKQATRRGIVNKLNDKVRELKRRNKTASIIMDVAEKVILTK